MILILIYSNIFTKKIKLYLLVITCHVPRNPVANGATLNANPKSATLPITGAFSSRESILHYIIVNKIYKKIKKYKLKYLDFLNHDE